MQRISSSIFFLAFSALLIGASTEGAPVGGELVGRWFHPDGSRAVVTFSYHREADGEGRISTRLGQDGERFVGNYLRITGKHAEAKVRRFVLAWNSATYDDFGTGPSGRPESGREATVELFRDHHRDAVVATLIGNRGNHMRCRFALDDPKAGLPGGASGSCQVSSGEIIELKTTPRSSAG